MVASWKLARSHPRNHFLYLWHILGARTTCHNVLYTHCSLSDGISIAPSSSLSSSSISAIPFIKLASRWSKLWVDLHTNFSFCPANRTARVTGFHLLMQAWGSLSSRSKSSSSAAHCASPIHFAISVHQPLADCTNSRPRSASSSLSWSSRRSECVRRSRRVLVDWWLVHLTRCFDFPLSWCSLLILPPTCDAKHNLGNCKLQTL